MSENQSIPCSGCRSLKTTHECGICNEALCRSCAIFLDEATFAFRSEVSPELKHSFYCAGCHAEQVEPEMEADRELLELARGVYFFFGKSKHPLPILSKAKVDVKVERCLDRDETILRLGIQAAKAGFNGIVDAEVSSEKVRDHGWQKSNWRGHGRPVKMDAVKLERDAEIRALKRR